MKLVPLLVCLLAAPALADTIHVDPGMSEEDIQLAIGEAATGDTVKFGAGVYLLEEGLVVSTSGVTLKGAKAVLDGQYIANDVVLVNAEDDVVVTGFTIVNASENGVRVDSVMDGGFLPDGVQITKNTILSCGNDGIQFNGTDGLISGNRVAGHDEEGIDVEDPAGTTEISKNTVARNGCDGILASGAGTFVIEKNVSESNDDDGIQLTIDGGGADGEEPSEPSSVSRNKCLANAGNGIRASDHNGRGLEIAKNTVSGNGSDGMELEGIGLVVTGNRVEENIKQGFNADVEDSELTKNRVRNNRLDGIALDGTFGGDGCEPGGNLLEKNACQFNGRDGIDVDSSENVLIKNKCTDNFSDGIDVNPGANCDNELLDNVCRKNHHEGIDNGGANTDIIGNSCKQNGLGSSPDIAGTGDEGNGTVGTFDGNSFDTGGEDTAAVNDAPDDV